MGYGSKSKSKGYDAPAEEDLLGRWPFAREIALIATDAPLEWSLRVGVYGSWGTGKTSVLGFVEQIVTERGHVCAWFNPWGHGDKEEMFGELADVALDALEAAGIRVEGEKGRAMKNFGGTMVGGADTVADVAVAAGVPKIAGTIAKRYLPRLRRFLKDRADDFVAIQQSLGKRRLIVLIDDVGRVDPNLLPHLLFALHEVLALPGFSYILALDPVTVGRALRGYHEGFDDGLHFLEKIIQFPRWIPEPPPESLSKLAEQDAEELAPEFLEAIRQEFFCVPTNPRALRTFVRNLWSLRSELDRHETAEIDWNLLVLLNLVRTLCPRVLASLLRDQELMDRIGASVLFGDKNDELEELQGSLDHLIDRSDCRKSEEVRRVLFSMIGRTFMWTADRIRYHGYLTDRPHAVTWKEFESLWREVVDDDVAVRLDAFVVGHAKKRSELASRVVKELMTCCLGKHHDLLDAASQSATDDSLREHVAGAKRAVSMLVALCFDINEDRCIVPDGDLFRRLLKAFMQWAHLTNHDAYNGLRAYERELTLRVATNSPNHAELLEVMRPWRPDSERMKEDGNAFATALCDVLRQGVADGLVEVFGRASGINGLLREEMVARRYVLFRLGEAWSDEYRTRLRQVVEEGGDVVAENCQIFLDVLVDAHQLPKLWLSAAEVGELAKDLNLMRLIWRGATCVRVNPRMFSRLATIRATIERELGPLPDPPWWAEAQMVHNEKETTTDDGGSD